MNTRVIYACCFIMIVVTIFLSACSSEEEIRQKQNDMFLRANILDVFSFMGAPRPDRAMINIASFDTVYDSLEIFSSEEEAREKYNLWEEVEGTMYAAPTELTFAKIDYVNEILEFDGSVEIMEKNGYSYPITINDFVEDIDKLRALFADKQIVRSMIYDNIVSFGEAYEYKKKNGIS